jgi:alkylation response protein AidB-like acyl-CoA dehydrogenase
VPGYLVPVDSLLVAAGLEPSPEAGMPEVGAFLVKLESTPRLSPSVEPDVLQVVLDRTSALLVERGEAAWNLLLALRRRERLSQIAMAVGAARQAHESSVALAREATSAKDPLALGQGVQFQVADNAIDLQVAETLALHCAVLADSGALTEADLALTRFMVLEAFERISRRAAHVAGLFASAPPGWTEFVLDLARRLKLVGGPVELDRRQAALGLLPA